MLGGGGGRIELLPGGSNNTNLLVSLQCPKSLLFIWPPRKGAAFGLRTYCFFLAIVLIQSHYHLHVWFDCDRLQQTFPKSKEGDSQNTQIKTVCPDNLRKLFLPVSSYLKGTGGTICTNCSEIVCANCAFIWVGAFFGGWVSADFAKGPNLEKNASPLEHLIGTGKRGHYERGLFAGGISRNF